MKNIKLLFKVLLVLLGSFGFFTFLDIGWSFQNYTKLVVPMIFAFSFTTMVFVRTIRKKILYFAMVLLALMIFLYLFNQLDPANWIGSLGFGELILVIICYMPEFVKNGYIEKF